ncbi:MAG: hypothetical protein Q8P68_02900 [Candidatus Peregrinibacteria bacterium]|nr:hypothetical protein [Candidatus Peregrinibacteria bacterium]MDZ4245259.1 hypothetical protein [Candidatus Gracilibacteria bacterium]
MGVEKLNNQASEEGTDLPRDFNMPEWLKTIEGLSEAEGKGIRKEVIAIAKKSRGKRERFSSLFEDHDGWEREFGNMEYDPNKSIG